MVYHHQPLSPPPRFTHVTTVKLLTDQMEGMEINVGAKQVKAEGKAAEIIKWMKCACPDMVPMAPLLEEILFAGFEESRFVV